MLNKLRYVLVLVLTPHRIDKQKQSISLEASPPMIVHTNNRKQTSKNIVYDSHLRVVIDNLITI